MTGPADPFRRETGVVPTPTAAEREDGSLRPVASRAPASTEKRPFRYDAGHEPPPRCRLELLSVGLVSTIPRFPPHDRPNSRHSPPNLPSGLLVEPLTSGLIRGPDGHREPWRR